LAAMSISCEQVGRHSPQPTQEVPFRIKAAYSLVFRIRQKLFELLILCRSSHTAHRLHGDGPNILLRRPVDPFLHFLAVELDFDLCQYLEVTRTVTGRSCYG
jgi:hypothetical protein